MRIRRLVLGFIGASNLYGAAAQFNNPAGVDVWCGKAYRATNASFEPGGWLEDPLLSKSPLLDLTIRTRMNIYISTDDYGSVIVDAPISYMHGYAYENTTLNKQTNETGPFTILFISILIGETGNNLVSGQNVTINSTRTEFPISLEGLTPRLEPYNISVTGASSDGQVLYTASTQLYYLPERTDGGSTVRIDSLYGGLYVQDWTTNSTGWTSLFPYTYYVMWDEWLSMSVDDMNVFKAAGYNVIHIVPTGTLSDTPFPYDVLTKYIDRAEEVGLWLMYDVRWNYRNMTPMTEQVSYINTRKSLLLYYTADEPDGQTEPLNATKIAYDAIKAVDPYHPVSLALNCYNFYFEEYSSGGDILLSDVYPIAVNTSWSNQYDTACNATYGCCGCDDCTGKFEDISERFDLFAKYEDILGQPQKPHWGVPQAFGNETFWTRYPSPGEVILMNVLSVNHGAKGISMWDYPSTPAIMNATSYVSKVLTSTTAVSFLLATSRVQTLPVFGAPRIDVSAWAVDDKMMISIINLGYASIASAVSITLPEAASGVDEVLWGGEGWNVDGEVLSKSGLAGLEVDIMILNL